MARYMVIPKSTRQIVNFVEWDGVSPWSPGPAFAVKPVADDAPYDIEGFFDPRDNSYIPPAPRPERKRSMLGRADVISEILADKGIVTRAEYLAKAAELQAQG